MFAHMVAASIFIIAQASADDNWYWKGSTQALFKPYQQSTQHDVLYGVGAFLSADYLERRGFALGYNVNHSEYKPPVDDGVVEIEESIFYISARSKHRPDRLPGVITLRLDGYIGNDATRVQTVTTTSISPGQSPGGHTNTVLQDSTVDDNYRVVNPIITFLNYRKTFYAELGYAQSHYTSDDDSTDDVDIRQWTPTVGFGFNRAYDWLQLRVYLINFSSSNRITEKNNTAALESKWTHWFGIDAPLRLHSTQLSIVLGERMYALDSDSASLFSVPDLQNASLAIGATWKLDDQSKLLLQTGYEAYENLFINDEYRALYLYGYLSREW